MSWSCLVVSLRMDLPLQPVTVEKMGASGCIRDEVQFSGRQLWLCAPVFALPMRYKCLTPRSTTYCCWCVTSSPPYVMSTCVSVCFADTLQVFDPPDAIAFRCVTSSPCAPVFALLQAMSVCSLTPASLVSLGCCVLPGVFYGVQDSWSFS